MAIEFCCRREHGQIATCACKRPLPLLTIKRTAIGPLGSLLSEHDVLSWRQQCAPFRIRMYHLVGFSSLRRRRKTIEAVGPEQGERTCACQKHVSSRQHTWPLQKTTKRSH